MKNINIELRMKYCGWWNIHVITIFKLAANSEIILAVHLKKLLVLF